MKSKLTKVFIILAVLAISLMSCSSSGTLPKIPETLDETEISATIKELIYEETRGYCFVVLETDKDDATLQFRTNEQFLKEETVKIGNRMDIVRKTEKYLDGIQYNYYFQGQRLNYPFVNRGNGTVSVTVTNAEKYSVWVGRYMRDAYKITVKDVNGNEFTAYDIPHKLWESLYIQQTLWLREEENTAKIKTYSYAYYLDDYQFDDYQLFTV